MNNVDYDEILKRIRYFRNVRSLTAKDVSIRLGKNQDYLTKIENNIIDLKVSVLLELIKMFDISVMDFFYLGERFNREDKNLLSLYGGLWKEDKRFVINFLKRLNSMNK
jgi:transcriptional regulator with XRE-family HTH domain